MRYNDGLYFIPLDYYFDYYAYDGTLLNDEAKAKLADGHSFTMQNLIDIAAQSFDSGSGKNYLLGYSPYDDARMQLMHTLLRENRNEFYSTKERRASFDDGKFAALLERVSEYAEKGYIPGTAAEEVNTDRIMELAMEQDTQRYFYKQNGIIDLLNFYTRDNNLMVNFGGMGGIQDDDEIAGLVANSDGDIGMQFMQSYAINQNSANKRTAWEFLKMLLSEEMQLSPDLMPFTLPLHNAAREKKTEMLVSGAIFGEELPGGMSDEQKQVLADYSAKLEEFSAQVNAYQPADTIIYGMIDEEVQSYFDGTRSAEDTAKALQSKVELYLSE